MPQRIPTNSRTTNPHSSSLTTHHSRVRCAIYTRKSSDEGLDMDFNTLDAQRESCEAYIQSQRSEGWVAVHDRYDDGGFSGGSMERPALKRLLQDIERGLVDCLVVYKLDRLTRSLMDFSRMVDVFDQHDVTFISVTQQFNTTTSMGRLTLNMLLSFAQFEREIIGERIRDKYASSKRKGKFMGGRPILGYDVDREKKRLIVNEEEAEVVRDIFQRFIRCGSATTVMKELNAQGLRTKIWTTLKGKTLGGQPWNKSHLYRLLNNPHYIGHVTHKDKTYPGEHEAIVPQVMWDKVQSILETNHRARGNATRNDTPALLRGLIKCGCCGCAMAPTYTRKKGKTYRYYVCVQASKRAYDSCEIRSISAGPIEEAVLNQLRGIFVSPEVIAATYRETRVQEEEALATLRQEQRRLKESFEALQQANAKLMTRAAHNGNQEHMQANAAKMAELQATLRETTTKIGTLETRRLSEQDVISTLQTMEPVWDELFPVEKARIVELLVDRVTVSPDGMDVKLRGDGLHSLITEMQGEQQ